MKDEITEEKRGIMREAGITKEAEIMRKKPNDEKETGITRKKQEL